MDRALALVIAAAVLCGACQADSDRAAETVPTETVPTETVPTETVPTAPAALSSSPTPVAPAPTTTVTVGPVPSPTAAPAASGLRLLGSSPDGTARYLALDEPYVLTPVLIDRGDGPVPAMADEQDRYVFGPVPNFEIDADGVVSFVHEASASYWIRYVGRIDEDGIIRDVHQEMDASTHSAFLNSHDLELDLDQPVLETITSDTSTVGGWWYRGKTLGDQPGCGESTLYADDADGYRRVLPENIELDTVVQVHASVVQQLEGADALAHARALLFSTTCPSRYDGVRLIRGGQTVYGGEGSPAPGQFPVWVLDEPITLPGGETEVRRVIDFHLLGDGSLGSFRAEVVTVEHLDGDVETIAITDWGQTIESVTAGYRADEAAASSSGFFDGPLTSERHLYRSANELVYTDLALAVDEQTGEPALVVVGARHVQYLRVGADAIDSQPAQSFGENAFPISVVSLEGEFLLAIGGSESGAELLPELLRWDVSAEQWRPVETTVTRQASRGRAGSTRLTPPSPPFPGAAAIVDMVEHDGTIWATGWATVEGQVSTALWRSADGVNWMLEIVPALGDAFGPEYGLSLSVTSWGVMISVGNATHYGAGIVGRRHDDEWSRLPFPSTNDATSIARVVDSSDGTAWVIEQFFEGPDIIYSSIDFDSWTSLELPAIEDRVDDDGFPVGGFWSLYPDHVDGPIAWYSDYDWGADPMISTGWQWHESRQQFVRTPIPGFYVGSDNGFVVTQRAGDFVVIPVRDS